MGALSPGKEASGGSENRKIGGPPASFGLRLYTRKSPLSLATLDSIGLMAGVKGNDHHVTVVSVI